MTRTFKTLLRKTAGVALVGLGAIGMIVPGIQGIVTFSAGLTRGIRAERPTDFNQDVRPILINRCFKCHGPDDQTRESGLRLDTRNGAVSEADSGLAAIYNRSCGYSVARVSGPVGQARSGSRSMMSAGGSARW